MKTKLEKGNIEDFAEASQEGINLNILKKSFDKMTLSSISLKEGSLISNCSFVETVFTNCKFDGVQFSKCDFAKSDMCYVTFKNCKFFNCSFDGSKFKKVDFDKECTLNSCSFNGIDPFSQQNVTGLNEDDFKVIVEEGKDEDNLGKAMKDIGFSENGKDNYSMSAGEDANKIYIQVSGEKEWKCLILKGQEKLVSSDINMKEDEAYLKKVIKSFLEVAKHQISDDDKEAKDNISTLDKKLS